MEPSLSSRPSPLPLHSPCATPPYPNRSMSSVLGKIEEDQRDVNQKSIENDELQLKLVMCPP